MKLTSTVSAINDVLSSPAISNNPKSIQKCATRLGDEFEQEAISVEDQISLLGAIMASQITPMKAFENKIQELETKNQSMSQDLAEAKNRIFKLEDLVRALTLQKSTADPPTKMAQQLSISTNDGQMLDLSVPRGSPLVSLKDKRGPSRTSTPAGIASTSGTIRSAASSNASNSRALTSGNGEAATASRSAASADGEAKGYAPAPNAQDMGMKPLPPVPATLPSTSLASTRKTMHSRENSRASNIASSSTPMEQTASKVILSKPPVSQSVSAHVPKPSMTVPRTSSVIDFAASLGRTQAPLSSHPYTDVTVGAPLNMPAAEVGKPKLAAGPASRGRTLERTPMSPSDTPHTYTTTQATHTKKVLEGNKKPDAHGLSTQSESARGKQPIEEDKAPSVQSLPASVFSASPTRKKKNKKGPLEPNYVISTASKASNANEGNTEPRVTSSVPAYASAFAASVKTPITPDASKDSQTPGPRRLAKGSAFKMVSLLATNSTDSSAPLANAQVVASPKLAPVAPPQSPSTTKPSLPPVIKIEPSTPAFKVAPWPERPQVPSTPTQGTRSSNLGASMRASAPAFSPSSAPEPQTAPTGLPMSPSVLSHLTPEMAAMFQAKIQGSAR